MKDIVIKAIGRVESAVTQQTDESWGAVEARIVLLPEYRDGLRGNQRYEPQGKPWTLNAVASHGESNPSEHREREGEAPEALPMEGATRAPVIEQFSHALIVTYLHQAHFEASKHLIRRPRGLASMPEVGIFAQRAKDRPNPLGITAVSIVGVKSEVLIVRGLDAIDGTPVIDVKPYYPVYDCVKDSKVPGWVEKLMEGYF